MNCFSRPNVLLLYTDQQRFDTLSYIQKNLAIQTPNIDQLAHDGACFTNCYTQSPICGPSRMSLLTGRYCSSVGVGCNGTAFPEEDCIPVNQILRDYGYQTAQLGKLHFQPHAKRDARNPYPNYGFDRFIVSDEPGCYDDPYTKWVECNQPDELQKVRTSLPPAAYRYGKPCYSDQPRNTHEPYVFEASDHLSHSAFVTSETCAFLQQHNPAQPFFAIAGFYAPHPPINPPQNCIDRVDTSKIDLPIFASFEETMEELRDLSHDDWIRIKQYYLALVLHVDDCIGQIIDTLKQCNQYDHTLIIFTSDHGEYLGDHGRIQKGMPGYDCCTHVPLIMSYPSKMQGKHIIDDLVEAVDIVPTILDYCGVQVPADIQGQSLKSALENQTYPKKEETLCEYFDPYGIRETTIRSKKYKYYSSSVGKELLFDLSADPNEQHNVCDDTAYSSVLSQMRYRALLRTQQAAFKNIEQSAEY